MSEKQRKEENLQAEELEEEELNEDDLNQVSGGAGLRSAKKVTMTKISSDTVSKI